jgi:hypothetical protein
VVDFYRYLEDSDVHVVDCSGKVNLELGIERLRVLERQLALCPPRDGRRKLLIDFRNTVWESEDVHMQLSTITRRDFGLNAENTAVRAAVLNNRFQGAVAPNEHWFFEEAGALAWLQTQ